MSSTEDKDIATGRTDSARSFFKGLDRLKALEADPVMEAVAHSCPPGCGLYLVGGMLRNIALGVEGAPDYDFACSGRTRDVAASVARALNGSFFVLDEEAGAWRVVTKGASVATVDFTSLAVGGIYADLAMRDFTVNAMAVDVHALAKGDARLIDPFGGVEDAGARALRKVSAEAFDADPLRLLRAARLSTQYRMRIEDETLLLVREKAPLLSLPAPERVRDELVRLFACPNAADGVALLFDTGLMEAVVPEVGAWKGLSYDLCAHSLEVSREADRLLQGLTDDAFHGLAGRLKGLLFTPGPASNDALFRLAALFHDIAKARTLKREGGRLRFIGHDTEGARVMAGVMGRLRFSRKDTALLTLLVRNHHRPFMLVSLDRLTERAKGHFFRAMGAEAGLMSLLLAVADARATRGGEDPALREVVLEMMRFYFDVFSVQRPGPVMTGREVMDAFGVGEGPRVGEILREIAEGVEQGLVTDAVEAVAYVRQRHKGR